MYGIDNPLIIWLLCVWSIFLLIASAERVVHHMLKIAKHFGVSDTFVGLTVLSIGTSLPEISSHIIASMGILQWTLDPAIASATVLWANIWSNIVQQTLIVGIVILMMWTVTFDKKFLAANYVAMLVTMAIVWILWYDGIYSQSDSIILLLLFVLYIYFLYQQEYQHKKELTAQQTKVKIITPVSTINVWASLFSLSLGMGALLISSTITLEWVQYLVLTTGVSGSLIWVVTLWVASALPELITAISGIRKNAEWISIGTLIGSNIVNPLVAIGLWWVISWYIVPDPLKFWDLPMQIWTATVLLIRLLLHNNKISRPGGIFLILLYVIYLYIRIQYFQID